MPDWLVRTEHDRRGRAVASAGHVLQGLRDGDWDPADEVRGPGDRDWTPIEDHPTFADAVAEMGPKPVEHPDETRLDMNPLIDVSLVLLIFFILTTSYASLKRVIELPETPPDDKAAAKVKKKNVEDRTFKVEAMLDPTGKEVVKIDGRAVGFADLEAELRAHMKTTGRKEVVATIADNVSWESVSKIHDAAKGAGVQQVYWPKRQGPAKPAGG